MSEFEKWFKSLNENGRVTYFLGQESKIAEEAWNQQQAIIDQLKAEKAGFKNLVKSLRSEFDLNDECPQVERQIELLEEALADKQPKKLLEFIDEAEKRVDQWPEGVQKSVRDGLGMRRGTND